MENRGRPRTSNRPFEHHLLSIDTMEFKKVPDFRPLISPLDGSLSVSYEWSDGDTYIINLCTTRLVSGGLRYWYVCPACDQRVRKLYATETDRNFVCRSCRGARYFCQYRKGYMDQMAHLIGTQDRLSPEQWNRKWRKLVG